MSRNPNYGIYPYEKDLREVNTKKVLRKDSFSARKDKREKELEDMGIFSCII